MRLARPSLSLEWRVTIAIGVVVMLFVAIQGALAYLSLAEQEDDLVDELVLAETRRLATRIESQGNEAFEYFRQSEEFHGWLVKTDGEIIPEPLPAELQALADGPHLFETGEADIHVYVMPIASGKLYVRYDATRNEAKVHEFGYYLAGLGVICALVGLALSRYVAAVVAAPIRRLTRMLSDWAPSNHGRIEAGLSSEEGQLLDAFGRVQASFEKAVADERATIANMRHELRTPLTALRTDLEMLLLDAAPDLRTRLERAVQAADAIDGAIASTTAIDRSRFEDASPMHLATCVSDAWRSLGQLPELSGLTLRNQVDGAAIVRVDRHALLTILRNLMRNAMEHAAPAQCTVTCRDGVICVEDDGRGIDPKDLPFVFERYYQGRRGDAGSVEKAGNQGLGLAIARQIADLNGWLLSVEPVIPRGTRFLLNLEHDEAVAEPL